MPISFLSWLSASARKNQPFFALTTLRTCIQIFLIGDNRDVAETHIKAAITPGANGRYIVSNAEQWSNKETADCLEKRFPGITLAEHDGSDVRNPPKVGAQLTEELLGRKLRNHCETWGDAIEGFWDAGLTANPGIHKEL